MNLNPIRFFMSFLFAFGVCCCLINSNSKLALAIAGARSVTQLELTSALGAGSPPAFCPIVPNFSCGSFGTTTSQNCTGSSQLQCLTSFGIKCTECFDDPAIWFKHCVAYGGYTTCVQQGEGSSGIFPCTSLSKKACAWSLVTNSCVCSGGPYVATGLSCGGFPDCKQY